MEGIIGLGLGALGTLLFTRNSKAGREITLLVIYVITGIFVIITSVYAGRLLEVIDQDTGKLMKANGTKILKAYSCYVCYYFVSLVVLGLLFWISKKLDKYPKRQD
jgi:hypothetical protein